jgi:UDP-2,3-diacylglucosamine hydrolase
MPAVLFLSDLHLDHERPDLTHLFLAFLDDRGRDADAIYILGDLFEAWVGDDDDSPLVRDIQGGMKACADSGTSVFVLRGNRDFLLGDRFARSSGCMLLDDAARIDLFGQAALLMHGDTLCTDDTDYLAFRRRVREHEWQLAFLEQPIGERRRIASRLREASHDAGGRKTGVEMDVSPDTVNRVMEEHGVHLLIHGHTHRRAVHKFAINGEPATRIVLGGWDAGGSVLEYSPAGYRFESLEAPA